MHRTTQKSYAVNRKLAQRENSVRMRSADWHFFIQHAPAYRWTTPALQFFRSLEAVCPIQGCLPPSHRGSRPLWEPCIRTPFRGANSAKYLEPSNGTSDNETEVHHQQELLPPRLRPDQSGFHRVGLRIALVGDCQEQLEYTRSLTLNRQRNTELPRLERARAAGHLSLIHI